MKALIQRVLKGSVAIDNKLAGRIGRGFVVLLAVRKGDRDEDAKYLANRTANLRIFSDEEGKMNLGLNDVDGRVLVISQFTLYADTKKGNRPGFPAAATPDMAERLYELYISTLRKALGRDRVITGKFKANMLIEIINEGPVTIDLNTDRERSAAAAEAVGQTPPTTPQPAPQAKQPPRQGRPGPRPDGPRPPRGGPRGPRPGPRPPRA